MNARLVPDPHQMRQYVDQGLTQHQIVDAWLADSGIRVSRSAVAMALDRYDMVTVRAHRIPIARRVRHRSDRLSVATVSVAQSK